MKLHNKISWLMWRVQKSLFPHLNHCLQTELTKKEERLVSILEIIEVERYVPKKVRRYQNPGRKPADRQASAKAFVAKAFYRLKTTSDLRSTLLSAPNLRQICGFITRKEIPSESTLSRVFGEFSSCELGDKVHAALVDNYLAEELIGHISRDSTAITRREKPAKKKVVSPPKPLEKEDDLQKMKSGNRKRKSTEIDKFAKVQKKELMSCHQAVTEAQRRTPRETKSLGMVTSYILMSRI